MRIGEIAHGALDFFTAPRTLGKSKTSHRVCLVASVVFGVFTLGTIHGVCKFGRWVYNQTHPKETTVVDLDSASSEEGAASGTSATAFVDDVVDRLEDSPALKTASAVSTEEPKAKKQDLRKTEFSEKTTQLYDDVMQVICEWKLVAQPSSPTHNTDGMTEEGKKRLALAWKAQTTLERFATAVNEAETTLGLDAIDPVLFAAKKNLEQCQRAWGARFSPAKATT